MSDQESQVESAATPEVQAQAEKMGWIPPSRFKGQPEKFVDADLYIERGETVLPIVREQNKRLHGELDALRAESAKTTAALRAAQTAIDQIEERHTVETQKAVEQARRQVKAQLAAASEAGDHEGVAELADQLTQLNVAVPVTKPQPSAPAPVAFAPDPELVAWNEENPWFGQNKRKTSLALGIAQELRDNGETSTGRRFFEKVAAEVAKELGEVEPRGDKVEGARGGAEGESRSSGRKGYNSLPADAKQACDAEARRFVGEGKKYKNIADWRSRYAEIYHGE
jgi:hypothetical protein